MDGQKWMDRQKVKYGFTTGGNYANIGKNKILEPLSHCGV